MSWERQVHRALDGVGAPRTVTVEGDGASAEVDVERVDAIGVRVRGVRVHHEAREIGPEAERLVRDLRSLPHRVGVSEVDPGLGGAILRSRPEELRRREYWEVRVEPGEAWVRKVRIGEDGERGDENFDLTREGLGRVIEELVG